VRTLALRVERHCALDMRTSYETVDRIYSVKHLTRFLTTQVGALMTSLTLPRFSPRPNAQCFFLAHLLFTYDVAAGCG
jgi:hypothetical protein